MSDTTIILKNGSGKPEPASLQKAELAIDVASGDLYTKLSDDSIALLNDSGDSGGGTGSGAGMIISETEPDAVDGTQWLNALTGEVFIYDDGKWLEFPGGKDGAAGADGNIANGSKDGVVATWNDTTGQWTPDSSLTIDAAGDAAFSGTVSANQVVLDRGIYRTDTNGAGIRLSTANSILPSDNTATQQDDLISLGDAGRRFKDAHFSGAVSAIRMELGANAEAMYYVEGNAALLRTRDSDGSNAGYFGFQSINGTSENLIYGTQSRLRIGSSINKETTGMTIDSVGNLVVQGTIKKNGTTPLASTVDIIKTLSTLRQATMDETQDIRESLRSAIDELVEGFEQQISTMEESE